MFFALRGVEGDSMYPTIRSGEWFIMVKARPGTSFRRGDIVSFITKDVELAEKGQGLLKRVIGLPGDLVEISDHQVYINGQPLDESYAHWEYQPLPSMSYGMPKALYDKAIENCVTNECVAGTVKSWYIPEGHTFVLGDNRYGCLDSGCLGIDL